ncbi:unnamed protein product, partial [Adineta steineri]
TTIVAVEYNGGVIIGADTRIILAITRDGSNGGCACLAQ